MRKKVRVFLAWGGLVAACSSLDPAAFRNEKTGPDEPPAGWAFDAGPLPDANAGGAAGRSPRAGTGSGGSASGAGRGADEGGASGESGHAGDSGAASPDAGWAGGGRGAAGGGTAPGTGGRADGTGTGGLSGQGGEAGESGGLLRELFFSEYVEGSSSYKALEIGARESSSLSGCRLLTYFNGSTSGSAIALDGGLEAGSAYVLCSSQLFTLLGSVCQRSTNLGFNGDDALALECDGRLLDVIGQIGLDPGDAWGAGETTTLNHTLRRRCSAISGDTDGSDAFEPARDWVGFAVDTFDGLGSAECVPDAAEASQP